MRTIATVGLLGCATMGLMPLGCGSRLGPVRVSHKDGGIDRPNLPDVTVERSRECVAEYGTQLDPEFYHTLKSTVQVDEDGDKEDVSIDGVPDTAPDFGACMRNVLRDMPISAELVRQGAERLKFQREEASAAQRSLMSSPVVVVVGVTIVVSELMLEAGAITILFAVTVEVVDKAGKDVMEAAKRWRRKPNKNRCLDAAAGGEYLWTALCQDMTGKMAAQCWEHMNSNETEKRNMCNAWFGN